MSDDRISRLQVDLEMMTDLKYHSSFIDFEAKGNDPKAPDEYHVIYRCKGLVRDGNQILASDQHLVQILLHAQYPALPPQVYFLSDIFHPNVVVPLQTNHIRSQIQQMLDSTDDPEVRQRMLDNVMADEKLSKGRICLDILDLDWGPTMTIERVVLSVGDMIQYRLYNAEDPLNREAGEWAQHNKHLFPVDNRPLRDIPDLGITFISDEPLP